MLKDVPHKVMMTLLVKARKAGVFSKKYRYTVKSSPTGQNQTCPRSTACPELTDSAIRCRKGRMQVSEMKINTT
ncbi:hypothetical protein D3C81_1862740 [compost metagenome]